jgi:hypothetical protein
MLQLQTTSDCNVFMRPQQALSALFVRQADQMLNLVASVQCPPDRTLELPSFRPHTVPRVPISPASRPARRAATLDDFLAGGCLQLLVFAAHSAAHEFNKLQSWNLPGHVPVRETNNSRSFPRVIRTQVLSRNRSLRALAAVAAGESSGLAPRRVYDRRREAPPRIRRHIVPFRLQSLRASRRLAATLHLLTLVATSKFIVGIAVLGCEAQLLREKLSRAKFGTTADRRPAAQPRLH